MSKILITGGLGNLGSWLTEYMFQNGHEVWVLAKNFRKIQTTAKYHLIHADLADYADLKEKLNNFTFDVILHAGSVNDGFVDNYFKLAVEVNTLGTRNLLEWVKTHPVAHFVYFSTFQVYGVYSGTITEETPTNPINDYGSTHLFAEYYVRQFAQTSKVPYTIIRLTNSYGCPKDTNTSKWYLVLNDLSKSAFEKKEIVLLSNGQAPRDFIWMGHVCQAILQLLSMPATNTVYNLSGEKTFKMIEIAQFVQQAYQQRFGTTLPLKINQNDTNTYPTDLWVSSQKLRSVMAIDTTQYFIEESLRIFELLAKRK